MLNTGLCYVPYVNPCNGKPYIVTTTGACTDACADGFYLDSIYCRLCNVGCATCSNGNACGSCTNGYSFNTTNGICFCPSNMFI